MRVVAEHVERFGVRLPYFYLLSREDIKKKRARTMAQTRTAWKNTKASKADVNIGSYVKLENLIEKAFSIVDVAFEPSTFDPKIEVVRVTITYDEDNGTEMEGFEFQFTTAQSRIVTRLHDVDADELPIGPVTIIQVGKANKFGTLFYDIDEPIAEIDAPKEPTIVKTRDANSRIVGQSLRSKSVR